MRLIRRNEAPVGGWFYNIENTNTEFDGRRMPKGSLATGLDDLYSKTVSFLTANNVEIPDFLFEMIEDQICRRQPEGKCRYSKKAGDMLSAVIHGVAGAVDAMAGTNLKQRARSCSKCGKRRVTLNNL